MEKSPTQLMLEAQRHADIRDIIVGLLSRYRGRKNKMMLAAVDLEVSDVTLYRWCTDLGIDIEQYRNRQRPAGEEI